MPRSSRLAARPARARLTALLLALALAAGACGGDGSEPDPVGAQTPPAADAPVATDAPAQAVPGEPAGPIVDLLGDRHGICAQYENLVVRCWATFDGRSGRAPDPIDVEPIVLDTPSVPLAALPVRADRWACGIDLSGTASCWGEDRGGFSPGDEWVDLGNLEVPDAEFTKLDTGVRHTCGLTTDGEILCWGGGSYGSAQIPALEPPPGTYVDLAVDGLAGCAIDRDGEITCWSPRDEALIDDVPAGPFESVVVDGPADGRNGRTGACAFRPGGELACWGEGADTGALRFDDAGAELDAATPAGSFTQLVSERDRRCAVRADGEILCWGAPRPGEADAPPAGPHERIVALGTALNVEGRPTTWRERSVMPELAPPGRFVHLVRAEGNDGACGVVADAPTRIVCWNAVGMERLVLDLDDSYPRPGVSSGARSDGDEPADESPNLSEAELVAFELGREDGLADGRDDAREGFEPAPGSGSSWSFSVPAERAAYEQGYREAYQEAYEREASGSPSSPTSTSPTPTSTPAAPTPSIETPTDEDDEDECAGRSLLECYG